MTQVEFAIGDGRVAREVEERLRLHDADFTPRLIAAQGLGRLFERVRRRPRRILDICAGAGVWSSEAKATALAMGFDVHVTAIELRPEELPHLQRNADEAIVGDWSVARELEPFDLIVGNPAFSIWSTALPELLRCLVPGGLILALFHNGLGQRAAVEIGGDAKAELLDVFPPIEQWRIRGPIAFRGKHQINPKTGKPYGSDVRDYSHWLWPDCAPNLGRGLHGSSAGWITCDLPRLPGSARAWDVRPGTEGAP